MKKISDREQKLPGYFDSTWPVECGGNRRQKSALGRLSAKNSKTEVITKSSDKWNVMVIQREEDEFFLGGTMPYFNGPKPYGWVQKINPETFKINITNYVVAEDCGKVINPMIVDGQVQGGVAQGIGACLLYTSPSPRDATLSRMPSSA